MGRTSSWRKKAEEFFPWEDEKKKRKPGRGDSIPPQTSLRTKVRSKPKMAGQEYLDMYLMMKEKERWEKFGKSLVKSQERAGDIWRDVKKEIIKTKEQLPEHPEGVMKGDIEGQEEEKEESRKLPRGAKAVSWDY